MLTKPDAFKLLTNKLREMNRSNDPWVVGDEFTIERPFGWVFFYNSQKFLETGDDSYALAGNGPAMVNKYDGTIEFGGTAKPPEFYIEEYERNRTGDKKLC